MLDLDCGMQIIQLTLQAELSFYGERDEAVYICSQGNAGCQTAITVNQNHAQDLLDQCEDKSRCSVRMHMDHCNQGGRYTTYEQVSYICVDKAPSGKEMYTHLY